MSPRPAAPSRASVTACRTTSASLWPASPRGCSIAHAAQDQRPALDQPVRVVPGTNADHGGFLGYSRLSRFY